MYVIVEGRQMSREYKLFWYAKLQSILHSDLIKTRCKWSVSLFLKEQCQILVLILPIYRIIIWVLKLCNYRLNHDKHANGSRVDIFMHPVFSFTTFTIAQVP